MAKLRRSQKEKHKGTLFVVSGPSGCGKTTLCERLLRRKLGLVNSISTTTRALRKGETKNKDYIFITERQFREDIKQRRFLEYAKVFGNYYGTPKAPIQKALSQAKDLLLCIDVQGAEQVKAAFREAVLIFILPPRFSELNKRLRKRSSDTDQEIKKRLAIARSELNKIGTYDYAVTNDRIEGATNDLIAIIRSTRQKKG